MLRLDQVRIATSLHDGPVGAVRTSVGPLDLSLPEGAWTAVIAPAGAGKTPLARVLAGLEKPRDGSRYYDDPAGDRQRVQIEGRGLRYLPGDEPFPPDGTVRETLTMRATLRGYDGPARQRVLDETVERWDLTGAWHRRLGRLPRTQRRRVALADAFLGTPGLVVLDDPFWGCDDLTIRRLQQAILQPPPEVRATMAVVALARSPFELVGFTTRVLELGKSGRGLYIGGWQGWKTKRSEATVFRLVTSSGRGSVIERALRQIDGVYSAIWHKGGPANTFELRADGAPRVREAISRILAGQQVAILELTPEPNPYRADSAFAEQQLPRRRATTRRVPIPEPALPVAAGAEAEPTTSDAKPAEDVAALPSEPAESPGLTEESALTESAEEVDVVDGPDDADAPAGFPPDPPAARSPVTE